MRKILVSREAKDKKERVEKNWFSKAKAEIWNEEKPIKTFKQNVFEKRTGLWNAKFIKFALDKEI